jgi:GTP cyclohydrolase II
MDISISNVANLPTKYGDFKIQAFKQEHKEHLAIFKDPVEDGSIVRVHSECLTGDAVGSSKCDCGDQLATALKMIDKRGGMVIYLRQEGRNIGLLNKVNAYALQDKGLDTVEANHQLGFGDDERTYEMVEYICNYYQLKKIRLLTNNPKKIELINGVEILERLPIKIKPNIHNQGYLETKNKKMGHLF